MGKRRHSEKESEEYIAYKLKKYQRKLLKHGRRHHKRRESSETSTSHRNDSSQSLIYLEDSPLMESDQDDVGVDLLNSKQFGGKNANLPAIALTATTAAATAAVPTPAAAAAVAAPAAAAAVPAPAPAVTVSVPATAAAASAAASAAVAAAVVSASAAPSTTKEPVASTSQTDLATSKPVVQVIEPPLVSELDCEILDILGIDPSVKKTYGKDIHADLAVRLQHMTTTGLTKELRKELLEKYLPPANCKLIDAPELNPEIQAAVSEIVLRRDKGIEVKQKQLASAITCLGEAMTLLLTSEVKDMPVIKFLMDASRLICDCQNGDSITRRNFIFYNLKKEMKDQLQKSNIDKYLFGQDLSDTLKAAKAISKSGADLKPTPATKPPLQSVEKTYKTTSQKPLNWKAPPPSRWPRGTQRMNEPAQKNQHANSSKMSSHRAPSHNRR